MYRPVAAVSFLVGCLYGGAAFGAEPQIVELWPGKTPGDAGITGEENSRIYQSKIIDGPTRLITNVTKPTLTIYQPPADKNTGTAMLICPGGGYHDLFWELEGEEVAAWLNAHGMTGIILKYRCPRRPGDTIGEPPLGPLLDAQRAVSLVRSRAQELGINPKAIGMVGFSAGGHLALATATSFEKRTYAPIDVIDKVNCRPDFAVLCYSGYLKSREKDDIAAGIHIPPILRRSCSPIPPTTRSAPRNTACSCTLPCSALVSVPSCTFTPPATMTSACVRTNNFLPAGLNCASIGFPAKDCSSRN